MVFETKRLILRPWREDDAEHVFKLASDPKIGPPAGWPVHTSIENTRQIIKDVLMAEGNYAVVLKGKTDPIGCVGVTVGTKGNRDMGSKGCEVGYWLGAPYWGNGYIPEAVNEILKYYIEDLGMETVWCGYYDGNEKSHRVQEKCGFIHHHTEENVECKLLNEEIQKQ